MLLLRDAGSAHEFVRIIWNVGNHELVGVVGNVRLLGRYDLRS